MSVLSAKNVILFRQVSQSWRAFAYSTSCEVELSAEMSDVSTGSWAESKPKNLSWNMRGSFLIPSANREEIASYMLSAERILCCIGSVAAHPGTTSPQGYTQDNQLSMQGYCVITDMTVTAGNGQKAGVSLTMKGSGALSYKENALKVTVYMDGVKVKETDHSLTNVPITWAISYKDPTTETETALSVSDLDSLILTDGSSSVTVAAGTSQVTWPLVSSANRIITAKATYLTSHHQEDTCSARFSDSVGYFGIVESPFSVTAATIAALPTVLITGEAFTRSGITMSNKLIVFARSDRQITSVKDDSEQEQVTGFTMSTVTIDGKTYYVAAQTEPSSVTGYQLSFS